MDNNNQSSPLFPQNGIFSEGYYASYLNESKTESSARQQAISGGSVSQSAGSALPAAKIPHPDLNIYSQPSDAPQTQPVSAPPAYTPTPPFRETVPAAPQYAAAPASVRPVERPYRFLLPKSLVESPLVLLLAAAMIISMVFLVPSGRMSKAMVSDQKDFFGDVSATLGSVKRRSASSIFELPAVYFLPWGEQKNPAPQGAVTSYEEDGIEYTVYRDETIEVVYWKEFLCRSDFHFARVTIQNPTQLRSAYAGGEFDSSERYTPEDIAKSVNAVAAINADFCGYRNTGVIIRQNTMFRNKPNGWDVLLIDSDGNFHIMKDRNVEDSGILNDFEIVNTFEFGPSLVIDGQINYNNRTSGCGETYNFHSSSPRTAIGQLGELTYLMCVAEGKSKTSWGVVIDQMAQVMYDKGCVQAYNLDGGKSSTLVFMDQPMNKPLWGGQRVMSDILYFATALPEDVKSAYSPDSALAQTEPAD